MCTCTSCKETDALADKGFAAWPRGDPAGPRRSAALYAEHSLHGKHWGPYLGHAGEWQPRERDVPSFKIVPEPRYTCNGTHGCGPVTQAPRYVLDFIATGYKRTGQAEAQPVSPAPACKPEQHFPELDRQPETCRIYTMPKNKVKRDKKQRRGRPEIPGRRVVVKLEEAHIKRASELGDGNVAAGIRQALAR